MRVSLLLLSAAAFVHAQTNTTACCNVGPGTVDVNQRLSWCRAQTNTCPELCSNGQTTANTCDQEKLTFNCVCLSGNAPNISDYAQTLPSLQCDEWKRQCINTHPNDLPGQNFCLSFVCGSKNATALGAGAGSGRGTNSPSSSGASGAPTTSATGAASSSSSSANIVAASSHLGHAALVIGLSALFGFAL